MGYPLSTFMCSREIQVIIIFPIIIKHSFYNKFIYYFTSIYKIYQSFLWFFPFLPSLSIYLSFFKSTKILNFLKYEMLKSALISIWNPLCVEINSSILMHYYFFLTHIYLSTLHCPWCIGKYPQSISFLY